MNDKFLPLMLPDEFLNKYLPLDGSEPACPELNWLKIHAGIKEMALQYGISHLTFQISG